MTKSIAIWYEKKDLNLNIPPEIDIHINHWKLKLNRNFLVRKLRSLSTKTLGKKWNWFNFQNNDYFIDFGLKISNGANIQNVCFYFPYEFSNQKQLIEDIGNRLNKKELLRAVFNEPYNFTTNDNDKYITVKNSTKALFNIYALDINNDIKLDAKYNGTIVRFPFKMFDNLPSYYRFRVKSAFVSELSYIFKPSNSFLESAYSSIEIIDFRINDYRNLGTSLIEHIQEKSAFNIALIHYFVMRSIKDEYIISNQELYSVRQLEKETWGNYITAEDHLYEESFAYHFKKKASDEDKASNKFVSDFSAVLKFRFEDSKFVKYFMWLLAFALFTEVFGSGLYELCRPCLVTIYKFIFVSSAPK